MKELQEMNLNELAIGNGMLFPIVISDSEKGSGWYPVKGDTNLIKHNLESLIIYPMGFRFRQEEYGTRLWSYIEEPNTQALRFYIKNSLIAGIAQYEPRIFFNDLTTKAYEDKVFFRFTYGIQGTSLEDNLSTAMTRN